MECKRHCWECRRRCVVCDFSTPACQRCTAAGVACPGYGDVRPAKLKWLPTGRVLSRSGGKRSNSARMKGTSTKISRKKKFSETMMHDVLPNPNLDMIPERVLFEAAEYYNTCIVKDFIPIHELGQLSYVQHVSADVLHEAQAAPEFLRYGLICMTLNHRINRFRSSDAQRVKSLVGKYHYNRGVALRSLSEHLNFEWNGSSKVIIAGIMTLLLIDIQNGAAPGWYCHLEGVQRLISLCGGFEALGLWHEVSPLLNCFWFVGMITNTTCPASCLTWSSTSHLQTLPTILGNHSSTSIPTICPPGLVAEIVRINHLRLLARSKTKTCNGYLMNLAQKTLERVHQFSPEEFALSMSSTALDWMQICLVFKSAVELYCILSLQSASVLPEIPILRATCENTGGVLQSLLGEPLLAPTTRRFMLWPLVVLGVEAGYSDQGLRSFVVQHLKELSHAVGTSIPLTACKVLERFWVSNNKHWDACFDRPYPFTMQIAVDVSQVLKN